MVSEASSPKIIIHTLGRFDIRQGDEPMAGLKLRKARALFIYLLLNPGPHDRSRLAGLLWGDCTEKKARHNLRQTLWRLRKALPPGLLAEDRRSAGLTPSPAIWVDAIAMETAMRQAAHCRDRGDLTGRMAYLQEVAELYQGEFLADLMMDDSPEFAAWRVSYAAALHDQVLVAMTQLANHALQQGQYDQALDHARRLLQLEPWWEEGHRLVMTLLALTGQRSAALAQYQRCRQQLLDEVGVEPMPETTALYQRLLRWEKANWDMSAPMAGSALRLPFIGREQEHARLATWWEESVQGGGRLALVAGEAGVGKTRLVEEIIRYAQMQGAVILRGRCYEFGSELPYQPIADALREFLRATPADMPSLSPVWLTELARLIPELREQHPNLPEPPPLERLAARQRLFEAVAHLLRALTQPRDEPSPRPLLFFLDDLHWADASSLDLLHYLLRNLAAAPIGLVGAYRPEETPLAHPLTRLRQGLSRDRRVFFIPLARLDQDAVLQLARAILGDEASDALGRALYRESEGNPFFLVETLYSLQEQGLLTTGADASDWQAFLTQTIAPRSVQDVIMQRVGRLSAPARRLLTLAAVIGRHFDVALLQQAARTDASQVETSLDEWLQRHLVRGQPAAVGRYDFQHDKIRAVVYETADPGHRQRLHGQVGLALEQTAGADASVSQLAYHWSQAERPDKAIPYLLQAGDQARMLYAQQEAVDYYRQALAYLEKMEDEEQAANTLMKLGLTYHNAFDFAQARVAYDEAFRIWQKGTGHPSSTPRPTSERPLRIRWLNPTSLDPALAPDAHTDCLIAHLFSGLAALAPDMSITPDVAQSWEVGEGGRRFIFHLRKDVHWRDGALVTAHDFEYAWKRVLNPATRSPAASFLYELRGARAYHRGGGNADQVGVRALDDFTLLVELAHPAGYFPQLLTHVTWYPVPRHIVEKRGPAWAMDETIVGNGAFVVKSWRPEKMLTLVRNPRYHGHFSGNVRQVELLSVQDWETRLHLYETDELDILGITYLTPVTREAVRQRHVSEYISRPRLETYFLAFDVTRPPFDDPRVRRAFVLASDRAALADEVLQGYVAPATGGLTPPGMPGHASDIALPFRPDEARRLLAQAGFPHGRNFPPIDALFYQAAAARGRFLQTQWQQILGVTPRLDVAAWPEFLARLGRTPYHIVSLSWLADYPDPDNFLWVSRARAWPAWRHAEYEELVSEARGLTDAAQRLQRYSRAETILTQEAPILPLVYERDHLLIKPRLRRYPMSAIRPAYWKESVVADA